eukprot:COSAG05_NODE_15573_length_366_cov_0.891386_1_plen_31_part_01
MRRKQQQRKREFDYFDTDTAADESGADDFAN